MFLFSMLRLTETSPEHRRGDLNEGEPWLRCSGTLQAGESLVWTPPQQLLLRLGDTEMSQHGSPISCPSRGSQGAPRLSAEAGFAPGACAPQPCSRCTGLHFGRVNTSRRVHSPVSFLSLFDFLEHFSLKI